MTRNSTRVLMAAALSVFLFACSTRSQMSKEEEALGLDPEGSPAELYVKMAEAYYTRGQTEQAFRQAQKALEADDSYPRAHAWTAYLYEQIGQKEEAQRHYDRAVDLAPNNSDIRNAFGSFLCREKQYAQADAEFAKAIDNKLYATPWIAETNAGDCAAQSGDIAKAEGYYQKAAAANPKFGPVLVKLADLASKRGDMKGAKGYLDRYFAPETARNADSSYQALTLGIDVERKLGNRKQAKFYEQVLKANFKNGSAPATSRTRKG